MRKSLCSLLIFGLALIPVFVSAGEIPADHPIFSEKNWIFEKSSEHDFIDYDGARVVYETFHTYRHSTKNEYSMVEGVIWGETVQRVYYYESNNIFHKAFRLLGEDGKWRGEGTILWPKFLKDSSGKIIGVRLTMVNEKLEIMFTRDVMRK